MLIYIIMAVILSINLAYKDWILIMQQRKPDLELEALPSEILAHIICFLKTDDLLNSLQVNKLWHDLIKSMHLVPIAKYYLQDKLIQIKPTQEYAKQRENEIRSSLFFLQKRGYNKRSALSRDIQKDYNKLETRAMMEEELQSCIAYSSKQKLYVYTNTVFNLFHEKKNPKNINETFIDLQPKIMQAIRENGGYWSLFPLSIGFSLLLLLAVPILVTGFLKRNFQAAAQDFFQRLTPEAQTFLMYYHVPLVLLATVIFCYIMGSHKAYNDYTDTLVRLYNKLSYNMENEKNSTFAFRG